MSDIQNSILKEVISSFEQKVNFLELIDSNDNSLFYKELINAQVDFIGDVNYSFYIVSDFNFFNRISKGIYGVNVNQDIILPLAAEFCNLLLGSVLKNLKSNFNISIDISPSLSSFGDVPNKDLMIKKDFIIKENNDFLSNLSFYIFSKKGSEL